LIAHTTQGKAIGHVHRGTDRQGRIRICNDRAGDNGPAAEGSFSPADGQEQPQVYVRLLENGGSNSTDRVLD
jgi:hypothetical protein